MDTMLILNDTLSKSDVDFCETRTHKFILRFPFATVLKMIGINLLSFGVELCSSAGFIFIPPMLLKNGFSDSMLTILLGIGPFLSLMTVPLIGHYSDKCQSRFGRRRPFMFALSSLMIMSLVMIALNSKIFNSFCFFVTPNTTLALGVVLLDFSSQALLNPCKALIPDIFHSSEEQNAAFTVYSVMLSTGGIVGYLITSINWVTEKGFYSNDQEKIIFGILSLFQFVLMVINLHFAKEEKYDVQILSCASNETVDKHCNGSMNEAEKRMGIKTNIKCLEPVTNALESCKCSVKIPCCSANNMNWFKFLVLSCKRIKFLIKRMFYIFLVLPLHIMVQCSKNFFNMPPILVRLFLTCLLGWMGIMCHDMYYSDYVGQVIYHGNPYTLNETLSLKLYDKGVRMGSYGLLLHCITSAIYAGIFQGFMEDHFGEKITFIIGMLSFSVSMLGTILTKNINLLNSFAVLSGLGSAAMTTTPYTLVTEYNSKKKKYYEGEPHRGLGEDMAVIDASLFLSQIIPSIFLGYIVELTGSTTMYMITAAFCGCLATLLATFIVFTS
ncbi:solute carrier family 45 member 3-like [Uloborus diversus]|uniref:solute carrier family 45 member 3-like n=1 Tax=Uloborus diversus TaxID=327109 RepID=UPI00240A3B3E|nr:solute carrier family 45 member 3-like [Uloborus diversus]